MKLFITLPLALFAGEVLAVCGTGTFSGSTDTWHDNKILDLCALKIDNVYYCGSSGTTIVHKQSQLMLRAGNVDSTVIVTCIESRPLYHCMTVVRGSCGNRQGGRTVYSANYRARIKIGDAWV
ncbi:hypothetical protein E4U16_000567 [Claviceps sp. LM84 group G4]|nr:hypothetical protein E4U16_000567 [Claviceps sp. LM84 group G4]